MGLIEKEKVLALIHESMLCPNDDIDNLYLNGILAKI